MTGKLHVRFDEGDWETSPFVYGQQIGVRERLGMIRGQFLFISSLVSMCLAQSLKILIYRVKEKQWDWRQMFVSGGMPSSHSALMSTLTMCMLFFYGWTSPWFAIALISSVVVMYDAVGVRRQAGEQSMILEELIQQLADAGVAIKKESFQKFKHWRRQGHTPREVLGGFLLGILMAVLTYYFVRYGFDIDI